MKRKNLLISAMLLAFSLAACSYSAEHTSRSSPAKFYDASDNEIRANAVDVPVDTIFTAKFDELINGTTFAGNYFIVPGAKFEQDINNNNFDPEICLPENALPSELVDCSDEFTHSCTLQMSSPLSEDTVYSICIMEAASYSSAQTFGGATLTFTTAASS